MYRNSISARLTRSDCEGSSAVDGTDDNMLWNGSEVDGNVRSECEEYVKMKTVTLFGKGR